MEIDMIALTALLFTLVAALYSSVGHGGGSGYLAAMALLGFAPAVMRPTALVLNIFVALIATDQFTRAGHFQAKLFWPFAAASIPAAFLGGLLTLDTRIYKIAVGAILLYSAFHMVTRRGPSQGIATRRLPLAAALLAGAGIGFLSGLVGVGGGIFLSPLLLLAGWANLRETAATSAAFILVNSLSGLAGQMATLDILPAALPIWVAGVVGGGWLGATCGSRRLGTPALRIALALVLVVAGLKMILT